MVNQVDKMLGPAESPYMQLATGVGSFDTSAYSKFDSGNLMMMKSQNFSSGKNTSFGGIPANAPRSTIR